MPRMLRTTWISSGTPLPPTRSRASAITCLGAQRADHAIGHVLPARPLNLTRGPAAARVRPPGRSSNRSALARTRRDRLCRGARNRSRGRRRCEPGGRLRRAALVVYDQRSAELNVRLGGKPSAILPHRRRLSTRGTDCCFGRRTPDAEQKPRATRTMAARRPGLRGCRSEEIHRPWCCW
jgi:hypothetical protein